MTVSSYGSSFESDNPFRYGTPVTGKRFAGRAVELNAAFNFLNSGKNLLILSDGRMGKSSFLTELSRRHARDFLFVYLDVVGVSDDTQFLEALTRALMSTYQNRGGVFKPSVWEMLDGARLKLAILEQEQLAKSTSDDGHILVPPPKERFAANGQDRRKMPEIRMCPTCEKPLKWVDKYKRHYCYNCKKYLPRHRKARKSILVQDSPLERICPNCGDDTFFIEKYAEYYCESCKSYPFINLRKKVAERFTQSEMAEVLELPQKIAVDQEKPVVVMLDGFDVFAAIGPRSFLTLMRDTFDLHTDAEYIFAGNRGEVLDRMFQDRDGPFFKFANVVELGAIDDNEMEKFLQDRFRSLDGKLGKDEARRIISLSGRCPHYVQQLAHELFHFSKEPVSRDLDKAVEGCIGLQSQTFKTIWESIRSPLQRRYLIASVSEPRVTHGIDFVNRHNLRSRSHVERIERQLTAKGILKDGEVSDPMLVLWLRTIADLR